jgi:hypothetical protein
MKHRLLVAMIVTLALTAAGCGTDAAYPTSTAVVSEADGAATDAFEVVSDSYDLYNTGELEAWVEVREKGSSWSPDVVPSEVLEDERRRNQSWWNVGARYVETECVSHGLDDWWDIADSGVATGYYFTCLTVLTDNYEDADARQQSEAFNWVVNDGVVVAVNSQILSVSIVP